MKASKLLLVTWVAFAAGQNATTLAPLAATNGTTTMNSTWSSTASVMNSTTWSSTMNSTWSTTTAASGDSWWRPEEVLSRCRDQAGLNWLGCAQGMVVVMVIFAIIFAIIVIVVVWVLMHVVIARRDPAGAAGPGAMSVSYNRGYVEDEDDVVHFRKI
uniref:ORF136 n=1 Tax=Cyprinid herpesvirus 3 TaxID=180230 RepID=G3KBB8_CYHV3|nr:ORF136 [Cyprinid herpesvirus 3]